jgi:hypothetical protein
MCPGSGEEFGLSQPSFPTGLQNGHNGLVGKYASKQNASYDLHNGYGGF